MDERRIRIVAVGDISLNGRYHWLLAQKGADYPFRSLLPRWQDADIRMGNLESPLAASPRAAPSKLTLRASLQALDALRRAGFDCLCLANNHLMDFGRDGLAQTLRKLAEAEIGHVGAGPTERAARAPLVLDRRGMRVGLLAFCDVEQTSPLYAAGDRPGVAKWDPRGCVEQVQRLRPEVDWLIVQMHWGTEMAQLPSPGQRQWARQLVVSGADLIIGHHPHVLQPLELIDGVPVFYSLGNFLFSDAYWRGRNGDGESFTGKLRLHRLSRKTGWVEVILARGREPRVQFHPAFLTWELAVISQETPTRTAEWLALADRLTQPEYAQRYTEELKRARRRKQRLASCRPLLRRVELKLFELGLLQHGLAFD